ncbi:hypothetical protein IP81_07080 [Novosphingobium sp. AAP83]|uniref:oxidoreductase n=1 Tax=Novosphingobium sp. AAP83 TaxID=1523425 RepID=UPI0006B9A515|nr:hypothetical protein [Novosphingobium sp. AAP83]KPF91832.1 hypothetical protein IP81_07080 [Novosphingobium sp. AAP83]
MTTHEHAILFEPFTHGSMQLNNRIVMAPMIRGFAQGGLPGADHVEYYRRRAEGGVGLILTEGAVIDRPSSRNEPASLERLVTRMERGEFDLIAVGRALIVDPDWANKVQAGRLDELSPFETQALASFV